MTPQNDPESRKSPAKRTYARYGCRTGKRGWRSRAEAKRMLKQSRRLAAAKPKDWAEKGPPTAVYKCPFCPWWHMTSQPQRPNDRPSDQQVKLEAELTDTRSYDTTTAADTLPGVPSPTRDGMHTLDASRAPRARRSRNRCHGRPRGRRPAAQHNQLASR